MDIDENLQINNSAESSFGSGHSETFRPQKKLSESESNSGKYSISENSDDENDGKSESGNQSPTREIQSADKSNVKSEELEQPEENQPPKTPDNKTTLNEDELSEFSDFENSPPSPITDLRQKLKERRQLQQQDDNENIDKENHEISSELEHDDGEFSEEQNGSGEKQNGKIVEPKNEADMEDGEVTDDDETEIKESPVKKIPAVEADTRPVCHFFTTSKCKWGPMCRFLHPGVNDKGNYSMFETVRPINRIPHGPPPPFRERPRMPHHVAPHYVPYAQPRDIAPLPPIDPESSWERGLKKAKQLIINSNKRKELGTEEVFTGRRSRSPGAYHRREYEDSPPEKYRRTVYDDDRNARYRELPPHRMPRFEEDNDRMAKKSASAREVVVQKADRWSDPYSARSRRNGSESPEKRRGRHERHKRVSSNSESSTSGSSIPDSRVPSRYRNHKRVGHDRGTDRKRAHRTRSRSFSVGRKYSPPSPVLHRRHDRRMSPVSKRHSRDERRKIASPPPKPLHQKAVSRKKRQSSSSDSESSSDSGSQSSTSSSSNDSHRRRISPKKVSMPKKRASPPSPRDGKAKSDNRNRRAELLAQLKAIEDAIERKKTHAE